MTCWAAGCRSSRSTSSRDRPAGDLDLLLRRMVAEVEAHHPAFVFVDSFCSLLLVNKTERPSDNALQRFLQQLGMLMTTLLPDLINSGRVGLVDSRAPDLSIDEIMHLLISEIRRLDATRVVIDSLSGFELALAPTFRPDFRESLSRMVGALAAVGVSVLMTSELEDRYTDLRFSPYGTAFMTDSIVVQRYIEIDSRLLRVVAVVKVRDSAHSDELRLFSIDDDGIQIGDMLPDQEGLLGGRPTRKPERDRPVPPLATGNGEPTTAAAR